MKTRSANHNRFNAQLALAIIASASIAMTGCTTFKRKVGDNSLDYTKTKNLNPSNYRQMHKRYLLPQFMQCRNRVKIR